MSTEKIVLIADDTAINRMLLKDIFGEKYRTILVEDGEQAIQVLSENVENVVLALLDIRMPKKSGFEVLDFMRKHNLSTIIPAIVITSSDDYQDELHAYNLGASDIIHKPFVPEIVLRRAENAIELIEHRFEIEHRLQEIETYDLLTGLYNMKHFLSSADEALRMADVEGTYQEYYFVYTNIRNFKLYNLNYGQDAGDRVLRSISEQIRRVSDPQDFNARFGSDHFVALIRTKDVMRNVRNVSNYFEQEFGKTGMSMKIGIYQIKKSGEHSASASDLAKIACDSIYSSNDTFSIYTEELSKQMNVATYVLQHFEEAIENDYIKVYYQPVVRTLSGKLCGMEALARWIDPEMGFLSPADFISVLENNRLISKLDLHMLRIICREMQEATNRRLTMVPVSFNLSRYDFMDCDIYAEIEKILKEYSIPRDMINIEITESTMMENPGFMQDIIERFRSVGYQVWMDDFGSGYSSLNVLKEFQFDEIKLDMKFLSSFNDNSKKIIESMILMAKKLGIQTLAEGVETEEQLEFLRSIGCEKAQGYLFSRPLPLKDLLPLCIEKKLEVELRSWRHYYDNLGKINYISERALSIVEFDGKDFHYSFVNPAFNEVWESLGVHDMESVYRNVNSETSSLSHQFRDLQRTLREGASQDIVYSVRGQYVRLSALCLAEHGECSAFAVEITNLDHQEAEKKRTIMDSVFRFMYSMYDSVYLLDINNGSFETIVRSATGNLEESKEFHEDRKIDPIFASQTFIHPTEREDYRKFVDVKTLEERLKNASHGYLTEYYRTKTSNGSYVWKAHTLLYVPENNNIIYCSRAAFLNQPGLIERIAPEYLRKGEFVQQTMVQHIVHQALLESRTINLFWKDSERRFLGANYKFLETYGFEDFSVIKGKTDEEIGWHVDTEPFESDEWRVIRNGEIIRNRIGKCIIRGVERNIMVCKEPLYRDGKIVGLVGAFVDVDSLDQEYGKPSKVSAIDKVTGLLSAYGVTNTLAEYAESWQARLENFAVIRIFMPEYYRAAMSYGETIAKSIVNEAAKLIADCFGVRGTCARLFAGNFVGLIKCGSKKEVRQLTDEIRTRLENVHYLAGYPVTLHPKVDVNFADESEDIHTLIGLAAGGTLMDITERQRLEEHLNTYDRQLQTVIDSLPGGVMLQEVYEDGSYEVLYASSGTSCLLGHPVDDIKRELNNDNTTDMLEEDVPLVRNAVVEAIQNNTNLDVSYRVYDQERNLVWLNMKGRVIGEQNGHPLFLLVFKRGKD